VDCNICLYSKLTQESVEVSGVICTSWFFFIVFYFSQLFLFFWHAPQLLWKTIVVSSCLFFIAHRIENKKISNFIHLTFFGNKQKEMWIICLKSCYVMRSIWNVLHINLLYNWVYRKREKKDIKLFFVVEIKCFWMFH